MLVASGELILFSDADLATPLDNVKTFIERSRADFDVVIASREGVTAHRIGEPAYRHFMGRVFNRLVQFLLLPGIEDSQCGPRAREGMPRAREHPSERDLSGRESRRHG